MLRRNRQPSPDDPELARYLSHYLVMRLNGDDMAIGEAGDVRKIRPQLWSAQIATWMLDRSSGCFRFDRFESVRYATVRGPTFRLISKKRFHGKLHMSRS